MATAIIFLAVAFWFIKGNIVSAQSDLDAKCQWDNITQNESKLSQSDFRLLLEECKKYYEDKSSQIEGDIKQTAQEKKTQASQIANLQATIKKVNNQIAQSNLIIKDLGAQISNTQSSIVKTDQRLTGIKAEMANLLKLRGEEDRRSWLEILLAEKSMASFFDGVMALDNLSAKISGLLGNIKTLKGDLETQKSDMSSEKKEQENVVVMQKLQQNDSAKKKQEAERLLKLTEKEYQSYLQAQNDAKDKVTKIGNLLFELVEVPEGGIKVEDAIVIAKEAGKLTGTRAAFVLAILWQETRIGKVMGGCYLREMDTGAGIYIKSGNRAPRTMNPTRDAPIFSRIVSDLNKANLLKTDVFNTPISCCMIKDGSYFGWGGAMGPAQFIPSTWAIYEEAVKQKSGRSLANPWNIRDAFLANAIFLQDLGAKSGDDTREMRAALRYFGCTTTWCEANYGRPVMTVASCFESYISKGSMSTTCESLIF
ncbi:MAG: hypothetical protein NTZ42_01645 [Candidatus Gribaldobacteria bacterium]|nr:hypothetical protein [Candidatus Gribaldobacteria bacterium]